MSRSRPSSSVEVADLIDLDPRDHPLVLLLRDGIDHELTEGGAPTLLAAQQLVEPARRSLDRA